MTVANTKSGQLRSCLAEPQKPPRVETLLPLWATNLLVTFFSLTASLKLLRHHLLPVASSCSGHFYGAELGSVASVTPLPACVSCYQVSLSLPISNKAISFSFSLYAPAILVSFCQTSFPIPLLNWGVQRCKLHSSYSH